MRAPYGEVGKLESSWYPLVVGDDGQLVDIYGDEDCVVDLPEIDNPTVRLRVNFSPNSRQVLLNLTVKAVRP